MNTEHVFDVATDLPKFLNSVLDKALLESNATYEEKQGYLELLNYTIRLLEDFIEEREDIWDILASQYRKIYILFYNELITTVDLLMIFMRKLWKIYLG